ncbi:hypothetical protein ABIE09_004678 [Lysobacter enzymogenes]|uniref:hypothetical protein n=1 Tax=Lysobacter enzymogenes TaxID=69 RepID=UPI00089563F9|nr:hypothetical protein [Lysobacter enzymogenes]SDX98805.1 hypothetical protein SAMN05421681_109268 [Lysobacter enzymogenes]
MTATTTTPSAMRTGAVSLLLWLAAAAAFAAINIAGGVLAVWLRLPSGGNPRLGWDLAWTVAAAAAPLWIAARWLPIAARAQAGLIWALLTAMAIWAVATLGKDFPLWFNAGLLAAQAALGWLAWRWSRRPR